MVVERLAGRIPHREDVDHLVAEGLDTRHHDVELQLREGLRDREQHPHAVLRVDLHHGRAPRLVG